MSSIENYWTNIAPEVAVASKGGDPYVHWLEVAWNKAREWNIAEDVRKSKFLRNISKRGV